MSELLYVHLHPVSQFTAFTVSWQHKAVGLISKQAHSLEEGSGPVVNWLPWTELLFSYISMVFWLTCDRYFIRTSKKFSFKRNRFACTPNMKIFLSLHFLIYFKSNKRLNVGLFWCTTHFFLFFFFLPPLLFSGPLWLTRACLSLFISVDRGSGLQLHGYDPSHLSTIILLSCFT